MDGDVAMYQVLTSSMCHYFSGHGIVFHDIAILLHFTVFHCLATPPAMLFVLLFRDVHSIIVMEHARR
jgi:hypothetical protein